MNRELMKHVFEMFIVKSRWYIYKYSLNISVCLKNFSYLMFEKKGQQTENKNIPFPGGMYACHQTILKR